jgi:hypothetical protein
MTVWDGYDGRNHCLGIITIISGYINSHERTRKITKRKYFVDERINEGKHFVNE